MNSPCEIAEYRDGDTDKLTAADIDYLKSPCFKYTALAPYEIWELRDGSHRIRNTSYSGVVQLEKERIHFSTKVKTNLFYMLSFLRDEKMFCYDPERPIEIEQGTAFFDVLARMFLNELEAICKKGFYKSYVRRQEALAFLKGKLILQQQLRVDCARKLKFVCAYEDLTYDNPENRIILRAATLLIPLIRFNEEVRRDLHRYSQMLRDDVSLSDVTPHDCDLIQFNRLNEYYDAIIKFSKVILRNYFIRSTTPGESIGFNFIVNMNKVYEDFITAMIEELVAQDSEFSDYVVEKQHRFDTLVEEEKIVTRPDVILRRKDSPGDYPMIVDAKYKRESSNADYYQVVAYSLAIPTARSCCLIYPQTEKVVRDVLTLLTDPADPACRRVKLHAVNIDLGRDLEFHAYVAAIKGDLKAKLSQCLAD